MPAPTVLPGKAFQQVDRRSRLLFHWRASDQNLITVNRDSTGVFTRASDGGEVAAQGGYLINPPSDDLPRYEFVDTDADDVRDAAALRLEGARTNEQIRSEAFDNAAWSKVVCAVNADSTIVAAPDGTFTADKVTASTSTGATSHFCYGSTPSTTLALDTSIARSLFVRAGLVDRVRLESTPSTDGATYITNDFDISTAATSTGAYATTKSSTAVSVTRTAKIQHADGWVRCVVVGSFDSTGTAAVNSKVTLLTSTGNSAFQASTSTGSAESLYLWGLQLEAGAFETSYIPTAAAAVTRAAETLYFPYTGKPQLMTLYTKFIERGTVGSTAGDRLLHIGAANAATDPRAGIETSAGEYRAYYDDGVTTATAKAVAAPSIGDLVELRWTVSAAGTVTLGQSINSGAEATVNSTATVVTTRPAFAAARLYLNSGGTSLRGSNSFISVKVAPGVRTMGAMREYF